MIQKPTIALIGAGSMGGALLRAWINGAKIDFAKSFVIDPTPNKDTASEALAAGLRINPDLNETHAEIAILAIKPQKADDVLPSLSDLLQHSVIVSVMAGASIERISGLLPGQNKICRAMPNLPALYGEGATGLFASDAVSAAERDVITSLMDAVGSVFWMECEAEIDFVTAVSGSGPAYYFLLTKALAEAGEALGLSTDVAEQLARSTLIGSGVVMKNANKTAVELMKMVTSPGGTTEAALAEFASDNDAFRKIVQRAVKAAAARAIELSS